MGRRLFFLIGFILTLGFIQAPVEVYCSGKGRIDEFQKTHKKGAPIIHKRKNKRYKNKKRNKYKHRGTIRRSTKTNQVDQDTFKNTPRTVFNVLKGLYEQDRDLRNTIGFQTFTALVFTLRALVNSHNSWFDFGYDLLTHATLWGGPWLLSQTLCQVLPRHLNKLIAGSLELAYQTWNVYYTATNPGGAITSFLFGAIGIQLIEYIINPKHQSPSYSYKQALGVLYFFLKTLGWDVFTQLTFKSQMNLEEFKSFFDDPKKICERFMKGQLENNRKIEKTLGVDGVKLSSCEGIQSEDSFYTGEGKYYYVEFPLNTTKLIFRDFKNLYFRAEHTPLRHDNNPKIIITNPIKGYTILIQHGKRDVKTFSPKTTLRQIIFYGKLPWSKKLQEAFLFIQLGMNAKSFEFRSIGTAEDNPNQIISNKNITICRVPLNGSVTDSKTQVFEDGKLLKNWDENAVYTHPT